MRVYELAKMLGVESASVIKVGRHTGYIMKSPSSKINMLPIELEAFKSHVINMVVPG